MRMFKCPVCKKEAVFFNNIRGNVGVPKDKRVYKLYKCTSCSHVFRVNWLKSHMYDKNYYSYKADRSWARHIFGFIFRFSNFFPFSLVWSLIQFTTRYQNVPYCTNGSVLDVGGGDGFVLDLYKITGNKTYNIEISDEINKINRSKGHKSFKDASTIKGIKFDLIRVNQVIEHVPDPVKFVKKLSRLLKVRGVILVGIPNIGAMAYDFYERDFDQLSFPDHFNFFSEKSIKLTFKDFKKVKIIYPVHKYGPVSNFVNILKSRRGIKLSNFTEIPIIGISLIFNYFLSFSKKTHFINIEATK